MTDLTSLTIPELRKMITINDDARTQEIAEEVLRRRGWSAAEDRNDVAIGYLWKATWEVMNLMESLEISTKEIKRLKKIIETCGAV